MVLQYRASQSEVNHNGQPFGNRYDVHVMTNCIEVEVDAISVGILNGAKPLTQFILNFVFGVLVDK